MPLVRKAPTTDRPADVDGAAIAFALVNGSTDERWSAARHIASTPNGATLLADALPRESDRRVREAMFTALAGIGTAGSIGALVAFIRADDAQLRTGALDALRITGDAMAEHLPGLLHDSDADVRILACELARNLPVHVATPLLCAVLDDDREPNVCAAAVEVLAEVGDAAALPALERCARRFRATPFLEFAIRLTVDRIRSQAAPAP